MWEWRGGVLVVLAEDDCEGRDGGEGGRSGQSRSSCESLSQLLIHHPPQTPSIHLILLKTVPLYEDAGNPLAKRRVALRSSPSSRAETQRLVDVAKQELFKLIPAIADDIWRRE